VAPIETTEAGVAPAADHMTVVRAGRTDAVAEVTLTGDPRAGWSLQYPEIPPSLPRRDGDVLAGEAITAALAESTGRGGGPVTLWIPRPDDDRVAVAAGAGLTPGRVLYEMRRPLPVDEAARRGVAPLETRAFRPGVDEDTWLGVNNRAFAWHPEQGGWDMDMLLAHEAEDWFDAEGFRVHETAGVLDGFCWTQVHADTDPVLGEIYVIAADPTAAGGGFGRRLVLAGLDHLSAAGITTGMLYTDADNIRAVKLYVDMGFIVHSLLQAFTVTVPAASPAGAMHAASRAVTLPSAASRTVTAQGEGG
jgi:mycothiol synthase